MTSAKNVSRTRGPQLVDEQQRGMARLTRVIAQSPEIGVIAACVLVFVAIWVDKSTFVDSGNLQEMGRNLAEFGTLAVGESFVILTGGIDLSVGALAALAGVFSAWLFVSKGIALGPALLITVALCAVVGLLHGWFITRLNVPPFVITLVTYTAARGAAEAITQSVPVSISGNGYLNLSRTNVVSVPLPAVIFVAVALVAWFVLERTYVGRQIYAVGGNKEAARLAGINTSRRIVTTYVVSAVLAGVVGILITARLGVGDPSVATGYELDAIAAAVIGGVSLFGGQGRLVGIAAGALLLVLINNGLIVLNVSPYYQQIVLGAVLFIAIVADRLRARRLTRARRPVDPPAPPVQTRARPVDGPADAATPAVVTADVHRPATTR